MTASTGEQSPFMESSAPMSPRPEHATHSARESFSRLMREERLPGELIDLFLGYHGEIEASHTGSSVRMTSCPPRSRISPISTA